jgi:type III restriction enzyme
LKKETMLEKWVPGVNTLGAYGRWAFDQFDSVFEIDRDFRALIERALENNKVSEVA